MMYPSLLSGFRHAKVTAKRHFILRKRTMVRRSKSNHRKVASPKSMRKRLARLKMEMEDISKEQQSIKEEQAQVRAKFNAVEEEYEQLRDETNRIIQQSADTQIRLGLMFCILKAREQGNLDKAAQLTEVLREMVGRDNGRGSVSKATHQLPAFSSM